MVMHSISEDPVCKGSLCYRENVNVQATSEIQSSVQRTIRCQVYKFSGVCMTARCRQSLSVSLSYQL